MKIQEHLINIKLSKENNFFIFCIENQRAIMA